MKKFVTHWTFAFVTLVVLTYIGLQEPFVKEILKLKSFDILIQQEEKELSSDIGIVTIDEKSIEKYGQWPWKRDVIAEVISNLRQSGAGVIMIPILFSEEDRLGGDDILSQTLIDNGVVIAQVGTSQINKNSVPRGVAKIGNPLPYLFEWDGMLGPIPYFAHADGVGVLNTVPEIDGVVRRLPMLMRVGDSVYPSIAIEVIRVAVDQPSYQVKSNEGGIDKMRVPGYPIIQTDANARIWLRWNKTFDTVSASEPKKFIDLADKTVILGITADGLTNVIASPKGGQFSYMPSAVALQNILDGDTISRPYWALLGEIATTFSVGFLLVLLGRFSPIG